MHLTLKDRTFDIETASVLATLPDPHWHRQFDPQGNPDLQWSLHIETIDKRYDGELWSPAVSCEDLRFAARNWRDLAGHSLAWDTPHDPRSGEQNGGFYVFDHEHIARATLRFLRRAGASFQFEWSGVCDVFWDEEFGEDVPFSVTGWAHLDHITVRGSERDTDITQLERLRKYLDTSDFTQSPIEHFSRTYVDGVGIASSTFTLAVTE